MPKLIEIASTAKIILVGGTICTGKDTTAELVSTKLNDRGYDSARLSMGDCIMAVTGLNKDSSRTEYSTFFEGMENNPWIAKIIAEKIDIELEKIVVISGLRRKCDAEYFHTTFPNGGYFVSLMADKNTLVKRMVARNRDIDFPPGTPEEQKQAIAKGLLAKEEKTYEIMATMGYLASEVRKNSYLIDTGKKEDTVYLESQIDNALNHFNLV